jgi:FSR family fosmidomycin resistance protein-like MFS transporter
MTDIKGRKEESLLRLLRLTSPRLKLILLSIMHLATDGLCSYLIFTTLYPSNPTASFLIFAGYNILAFVTQSPVGILIDKHNKPKLFLGISVILMLLGYALCNIWALAVVLIGLSNSLFHVAGGKYVTDKSGNDISHLGIFVSTGAVGLVLGQRYLSFLALPYILFAILILCAVAVIFSDDSKTLTYPEEYESKDRATYVMLAVMAVVLARSFVGKVVSADFTLSGHILLLIALATSLGKAMGGVCAKAFGVRPTTYVSMAVAAVCLTLGTGNPYTFILGIFAFNFTMPITLYYANILQKGKEGFAFGTLAAVLAPGYFIAMSFSYTPIIRILCALLCVFSTAVIIFISRRIRSAD